MVGRKKFNQQDLLNEIAKCVLVCANCHQIKTYESNDYRQLIEQLSNYNNQRYLITNYGHDLSQLHGGW
jgi:hypothetical protein